MLKSLQLRNFKAWREVDIEFGKVTGFFGTNSAGKSSLFQLLLLLKQTRDSTDRALILDFGGSNDLVNLGSFKDVVHQHDEEKRIGWLLDWQLPRSLKVRDPLGPRDSVLFEDDCLQTRCQVGLRQARLWPYELTYRFGNVGFTLQPKDASETEFELATDNSPEFQFRRNQGRPWALPHPVKTYLFPNQAKTFFQNADFLGDFEFAYEELMDSIYYLGPLREYPQRDYHWSGSMPRDVGPRGERTVDVMLAASRDGAMRSLGYRQRRKSFEEMIAYWLRELGLIQQFRLEEIKKGTNLYQAMVQTSESSVSTALTDVGFGVSQVLPALVLLYYVPEGATVLMEQPEIHLHPAVQSGLADVILNVAEARSLQILVESHSEHLMRRLQRRVAEERASFEDVRLYFVETRGGVAHASDLALNKWGEIENWPEEFFGDEMGEIAAITKESLRRKLEQSR